MSRPRLATPAIAALLGLAVVGVLAVGLTNSETITVTAPVLLGQPGVVNVNNSPQVVRNPHNPANVVVASRMDRPEFSASVSTSTDHGRTWTDVTPPLPDGLDRPFAPSVAFDPDGVLHVTYVNLTGPGNTPETLWHASSTNGGRSLSDPTALAGEHAFQARLVTDPSSGTLHVTWLQADELGLLSFPGSPRVVAAHSTDGGATWSEPVRVSDPGRLRVGAAVPVVTGAGDLVVVYEDFRGDRRDFEGLEGPAWDEPFAWVATRSSDGGRSFEPGIEIDTEVLPTRRFLPFLPAFPGVAARGESGVVVTWADGRNGDLDVFLRSSVDAGRTWSAPTRVNDNRLGDGTSQYLPAVDIAPGGRVDVAYLDRRDDPTDVMTTASLAMSTDGGHGFRTVRMSPRAFDSRVGARAAPYLEPDAGSRLGVSSTDDGALVAWPDTTLGDATSGRQDVVSRRVRVAQPWLTLGRAGLVAALLAVAGVLVLVRGAASPRWSARGTGQGRDREGDAVGDAPDDDRADLVGRDRLG